MNKKNFRLYDFLPLIALVVLVIVFGATSGGKLFTGFNLMSIITQSIPVIIGGMGVMFAVSMGGCDLSVGGVAAVSATVGAYLGSRYGLAVMILVSLVIGLASGCLVGAIVSRLHVPSFMVTLAEKSGRLGGNLHPAGAAFFKEDIAKLCSVLERRVAAAKVNVLLKTEVTPEFVREFDPDALIVAIGANELRPPIKGMDGPNVVMAIDAELHPEKLGRRVAIMGGGLVGGEAAISFAHEGREVSIIEMKGAIAEEVNSFYRGGLLPRIEKAAKCYVNTKVKKITPKGVLVERDGEEFVIEADSVVCALGFRAPWALTVALCAEADESYMIGDCRNVGMIYQAINQGYFTAMQI